MKDPILRKKFKWFILDPVQLVLQHQYKNLKTAGHRYYFWGLGIVAPGNKH